MGEYSDVPPLCENGCGFYGSVKTKNLCSKCYNDYLKQSLVSEFEDKLKVYTSTPPNPTCVSPLDLSSPRPGPGAVVKNRCQSCNKKVGLLGFSCRCGKLFCGTHRYPEEHSCNVDYQTPGRLVLAKQNPLIKDDKLGYRI